MISRLRYSFLCSLSSVLAAAAAAAPRRRSRAARGERLRTVQGARRDRPGRAELRGQGRPAGTGGSRPSAACWPSSILTPRYIGPEEVRRFRAGAGERVRRHRHPGHHRRRPTDDHQPAVRHARLPRGRAGRRPHRRGRRQEHGRPDARRSRRAAPGRRGHVGRPERGPRRQARPSRRSPSSARRSISKPCWATTASRTARGTTCSIRKHADRLRAAGGLRPR